MANEYSIIGYVENEIKKNHYLYKLYLKTTGKWGAYYPQKSHDLFLTGYKRSGNTYSVNLIRETIPGIKLSSHIHTIGAIKYSLKIGLKTVVNFRNPVDTIISAVIREMEVDEKQDVMFLAEKEEKNWIEYYEYCLSKHKELYFSSFENLTTSPKKIVNLCSKITNLDCVDEIDKKSVEIYNKMLSNDTRKGGMKNLRSKEKKDIINQNKTQINQVLNIERLQELYMNLVKLQSF